MSEFGSDLEKDEVIDLHPEPYEPVGDGWSVDPADLAPSVDVAARSAVPDADLRWDGWGDPPQAFDEPGLETDAQSEPTEHPEAEPPTDVPLGILPDPTPEVLRDRPAAGAETAPRDVALAAARAEVQGALDYQDATHPGSAEIGYMKPADASGPAHETTDRPDNETRVEISNGDAGNLEDSAGEVLDVRSTIELNESERGAIKDYTGTGYGELNYALREGALDVVAQIASRSASLTSALEQLPAHEGTVVRGAQIDEDDLKRYEPGETIVENQYLSTTTDPEHEFGGNVLWIVESKQGRDVSEHAQFKDLDESEVLFDRFSQFEVLAKDYDDELGRWVIYMHEQ